ncbi:MAG: glycoside hydrolase family 3 protein [Candidatus Hydrogenedentes bacterium]|nr:glycoside hydrolase family 3 protein [Candidatus Hydrogenedentota bacterium]
MRRGQQEIGLPGRWIAAVLLMGVVAGLPVRFEQAIAQSRERMVAPPSLVNPTGGTTPRDSVPLSKETDPASLKPLLAALMVVSMDCALKLTPEDGSFLDRLPPGGAWIRAAGKPENLPLLVAMLRQAERRAGRPMLIGADPWDLTAFMAGTARGSLPPLPPLMAVAATGEDRYAVAWADVVARTMRGLGMDWMPGPDLSLWPDLPGSAASTRCIGSRPHEVARLGVSVIRRLGERGVLATPWGFPGGSWTRDWNQPPVLTTPPDAWPGRDGLPYAEALRAARVAQVGDVEVPMWSGGPACLNATVLQDLLRRQLGFRGIVLAGPVDGETLKMDAAEAARQALLAGADMILWQGGLRGVERAIDYLAAAAARGDLPAELVREKATRVAGILSAARQEINANASGGEKPEDAMTALQRTSLTLLHLRGDALPLGRDAAPVGLTGTVDLDVLQKGLRKSLKTVVQQPIMSAGHAGDIQTFEIDRLTRNTRGLNTVVIVVTERERVETLIELTRALRQQIPRVIVVFLGRPDYATRLTDADAVLLAWGCAGARDTLMRVVADALTGRCALGLVDLPDTITLPPGESRVLDGTALVRAPAGRLPCGLGEDIPEGFFRSMPPGGSLRDLTWKVNGKKEKGSTISLSADPVRPVNVSLAIRDVFGNARTVSFTVVSGAPGNGQ